MKYKLEDICNRIYSGGTPSTTHKEYWNGDLPWLSSGETSQRFVYTTEKFITKEGVQKSSTKYAKRNSIVMASAGQGHTRGQVSFLMNDMYINQSVLVFEPEVSIVNPLYLYYNLDGRYEELRQLSDGTSTRGSLSGRIVKGMEIDLPNLSVQDKIVSVLYDIDKKIENNNQINRNLSEQARSVYMETFGKFEKTKVLEDYPVKIYSGGTPSTSKKEYWEGGDIHWLSSGETANEFVTTTDKTITQLGVDNSSTKWASKYDVVTASAGQGHTRGQTTMILLNTCINQSVIVTHAAKEYMPFIFFNLSGRYEELRVLSDGTSTRGSLTTKIMAKLKMPDVTENTIIKFSDYAWSAISQIEVNLKENEKLACLRDSLLLKLMTGEIDVSDLNI